MSGDEEIKVDLAGSQVGGGNATPNARPIDRGYSNDLQAIYQLTQEVNPQGEDFFLISSRKGFLGGTLYTVGFRQTFDGRNVQNYVFKHREDIELYRNDREMIDGVTRRSASRNPFTQLLDPDLVPGLIALVIIVSIAALIMIHPAEPKIPDVLSSGLALILGFYFGRKTG